nr:class I SAM-dependent methyltransferase [uncultured Helicobacter sp.]
MDKTYWREFYSRHKIGVEPSLFAKLVYKNYLLESIKCDTDKYAKSNAPSLLELGCGNGRDSLYFAHKGVDTTAIDQVQEEIAFLNKYVKGIAKQDTSLQDLAQIPVDSHTESTSPCHIERSEISQDLESKRDLSKDILPFSQDKEQSLNAPQTTSNSQSQQNNPRFLCGDFTQLDSFGLRQEFDCIYSRFTLHSISKEQQDKTLADCLKYCKEGGILAIEVRGEKNSLCGKGKAVENETNAFIYDNHYRRFLNFTQTLQEIESLRFTPNNVAQRAINQNNMNNTHTTAGGGVYIMLLLIVLKLFTQWKTKALHHLMVKMTTLFALLQERSALSFSVVSVLCKIYSRSRQ